MIPHCVSKETAIPLSPRQTRLLFTLAWCWWAAVFHAGTARAQATALLVDLTQRPFQQPVIDAAGVLSEASVAHAVPSTTQPGDPEGGPGDWLRLSFENASVNAIDAPAFRRPYVRLSDGQLLPGTAALVAGGAEEADPPETVTWRHGVLGTVEIALDTMQIVDLVGGTDLSAAAPDTDTLVLVNGDRLNGFLLGFWPDAAAFIPDGQTDPLRIGLDRVAAVRLANPPTTPPVGQASGAYRVELIDGSVIHAEALTLADRMLQLQTLWQAAPDSPADPGGVGGVGGLKVPAMDVVRIDRLSGTTRLVDLIEQPFTVTDGGDVFGLSTPPRVVNDRLHLHAPVTLTIDLPEGAQRLLIVISLNDTDAPAGFANTADCLVEADAGASPARVRLWRKASSERLIVDAIDGVPLTLTVDPGRNGPVLDRLRVDVALAVVEDATASE